MPTNTSFGFAYTGRRKRFHVRLEEMIVACSKHAELTVIICPVTVHVSKLRLIVRHNIALAYVTCLIYRETQLYFERCDTISLDVWGTPANRDAINFHL